MTTLIIACLPIGRYVKIGTMPKKRKSKRFRAVKEVKAMARERIGAPPTSQVVPNRKRKRSEKHKPTLAKILGESD
jgi:hypothetical protein